jgi:hypothetical protein
VEPRQRDQNAYTERFSTLYLPPEDYETFNLTLPDEKLKQMLVTSLNENRAHWNQAPWSLEENDKANVSFFLGDQLNDSEYTRYDIRYKDNRLFTAVRAILAYATGQMAKPELTPSKSDEIYIKGARDLQMALYQHSLDEKADRKFRAAAMNLIIRKRGFLKLRWDPNAGYDGDVVTEVCNPEDIIIDRNAKYLDNPNVIYHRLRCSVDELIMKFPGKADEIKKAFGIVQGRYTQMSRFITYFEAWFTYIENGKPKEGVCWFLPDEDIILDKQPNPNWVYTGSDKKEKEANLLSMPPKPFVPFNYMNMGESYIDETSLFEQARDQQEMLNKRGRQIMENADYVNGRYIASKDAFNEEDTQKLVNKGARTVLMAKGDDISKAFVNVGSSELPAYAVNTMFDARNEIDNIMGTPAQFRGAQPQSQDTATRDLLVKNQAGALQDDLVLAISDAAETYYKIKLQMMRVYYAEDHWFACKGGDGKYTFILLNGENIDSNVKIGVQTDSTLPLDKQNIRSTAMELWQSGNAIDYLTLMQDLGLPDPEIRAERYLKSNLDPQAYLKSIELDQINTDAEADIQLLIMGKVPEERDNYSADYLNYYNSFMASNRFQKLDIQAQEKLTAFLMAVQHVATNTANLTALLIDDAGMVQPSPAPITPTAPTTAPVPSGVPPQGVPGMAPPPDIALSTTAAPVAGPGEATPPVPTQ